MQFDLDIPNCIFYVCTKWSYLGDVCQVLAGCSVGKVSCNTRGSESSPGGLKSPDPGSQEAGLRRGSIQQLGGCDFSKKTQTLASQTSARRCSSRNYERKLFRDPATKWQFFFSNLLTQKAGAPEWFHGGRGERWNNVVASNWSRSHDTFPTC